MAFLWVVTLLALALCTSPCYAVDDIAFNPDNGHYYQVIIPDSPVTYSEAKEIAKVRNHNSKQGYVATLSTATETAFVDGILRNQLPPVVGDWPTIWVGQEKTGNRFYWTALGRLSSYVYDTAAKYCNPDEWCNWNSTASFPTGANCVQIFGYAENGPPVGKWRAANCSSKSPAVIMEYDASKVCDSGYVYSSDKKWCVDVDECNGSSICGTGYVCQNTVGSYECVDVDECEVTPNICGAGFRCINRNGTYSCVDFNECTANATICQKGYECHNSVGSYSCDDINECVVNATICSRGYVCMNNIGSYVCADIDECVDPDACPFGSKCHNAVGSYTCDTQLYFIQSELNNLVIDQKDVNGVARLITAAKKTDNVTSQLFRFNPDGFIINELNGHVVDAEGGLLYPEVKAILWPMKWVDNAFNQLWLYDANTRLWKSQGANVVLDILYASSAAGAQVIVYTPKATGSNANQRWRLVEYQG